MPISHNPSLHVWPELQPMWDLESLSENSMRQWPRISCQDNRHARWMVRPSCYAAAVLHLRYDLQSYLSTKLYIIIQYAPSTREAHSGAYYGALVAQPRWGKPNKSIHQDTGQTLGPYNPGLNVWLRLQPTGYPRVSIGWFNEAMAANLMLSQQSWWASCCIHVCGSSSCTQCMTYHLLYGIKKYHHSTAYSQP
jgi:hypothetical protein